MIIKVNSLIIAALLMMGSLKGFGKAKNNKDKNISSLLVGMAFINFIYVLNTIFNVW